MPGAAQLAALAAQHAGAGYVKLMGASGAAVPPDLVCENGDLTQSLCDERLGCVLIGPGLGRGDNARDRLRAAFTTARALVLDADALTLLEPSDLQKEISVLATPHDGELAALCRAFGIAQTNRREKVRALAKASGMVICAKGPDTLVAAPDGRLAFAPPATSWLSVAGSGDVLAGIAASRMAGGVTPFQAACEAVWLHGEAARFSGPAFTPSQLLRNVAAALGSCL
jgi:ADP-dependent NAD(P)H-hydrate dehydratase / NAD(P)H-hydrate epimerase